MARPSKTSAIVDAVLEKQLRAAQDQDSVSAVFTLRSAKERILPPAKIELLVREIVDAATRQCSTAPEQVTVFKSLQSFAVQAPAAFVRSVLSHPAIGTAAANVQDEDLLIRPVKKKIVKLPT